MKYNKTIQGVLNDEVSWSHSRFDRISLLTGLNKVDAGFREQLALRELVADTPAPCSAKYWEKGPLIGRWSFRSSGIHFLMFYKSWISIWYLLWSLTEQSFLIIVLSHFCLLSGAFFMICTCYNGKRIINSSFTFYGIL